MTVIELNQVSKSYQLGASRTSLREAIADGLHSLVRPRHKNAEDLFWAMRDVSFQVKAGEVVGVIGHNGAGKSTMLKLLSRVTYPTEGYIHTSGRMASLIELGAGFHPDLSGRENVYLNGSILGLKRQEINDRFDAIVSFAGLEKFIDTPVKRYSSGMYVRLAFAVAAHVKADLLLVDEVLSVGDMAFQDRSLAKMKELRDNGATIVFISHNLAAVHSFCSRVIIMDHGRLVCDDVPTNAFKMYERLQTEEASRSARLAQRSQGQKPVDDLLLEDAGAVKGQVFAGRVDVCNSQGQICDEFNSSDGLLMRGSFNVTRSYKIPIYGVRIIRASDQLICINLWKSEGDVTLTPGTRVFELCIKSLLLLPGDYELECILATGIDGSVGTVSGRTPFRVLGVPNSDGEGVFVPEAEWRFDAGADEPLAESLQPDAIAEQA